VANACMPCRLALSVPSSWASREGGFEGVSSLGAQIKNGGTKRMQRMERMLGQRHTATAHCYCTLRPHTATAHCYCALLLRLIRAE